LGLTHGAISHRIRELELLVGTNLFNRVGRGMVPTREGVTLLAQARQALAMLRQAFPPRPADGRDVLVVSAHPAFATRWLVPRLPAFCALQPEADIDLRSTADLNDFLDHGVDVAVRYGSGPWPHVIDIPLGDEVWFPVCTQAYRDELGLNQPADLSRATLLRHAWQPWSPWLRVARVAISEPDRGMILSDSAMLVEAAANGQGVALAPRRLVETELELGRLIRPFDLAIDNGLGYRLAWRAGTRQSPLAEAFKTWISQRFQD
jgi:LysR family glycine cleavage system transcriptional activator